MYKQRHADLKRPLKTTESSSSQQLTPSKPTHEKGTNNSTWSATRKTPSFLSKNIRDESDGTLTLVSDTFLSVARKLRRVFKKKPNDSRNSRLQPKIKRIYVIKFADKSSGARQPRLPKVSASQKDRKPKGETVSRTRMQTDEKGESFSDNAIYTGTQSHEDDGSLYQLIPTDEDTHKCDNLVADDEPFSCKSPHKQSPFTRNGYFNQPEPFNKQDKFTRTKRSKHDAHRINYRTLYRRQSPQSSKIKGLEVSNVFQAILDELEPEKQRSNVTKKKRQSVKGFSEILDAGESLVSSQYAIPSGLISHEAVARLQVLIDQASKKRMNNKQNRSTDGLGTVNQSVARTGLIDATVESDADVMTTSSSVISGPICRICHGKDGALVKPCNCRGSLAYVHIECLQVWLTEKETNSCELCNYTFNIIHTPRHFKLIPSLGFWFKFAATPHQRTTLVKDLTLGVALLPILIFLAVFVRYYTNESYYYENEDGYYYEDEALAQVGVRIGLKIALFVVLTCYLGGIAVRTNHHLSAWLSWFVNKRVTVIFDEQSPADSENPN